MLEGDRDIASTARAVRAIYDDLAGCGDLRPSLRVDAAFARLVRLVVEAPAGLNACVLRHPAVRELVPRLRALCVEGEHQVERLAHRIATSARPRDELRRFPYVENYRMLHALEWDALARLGDGAASTATRTPWRFPAGWPRPSASPTSPSGGPTSARVRVTTSSATSTWSCSPRSSDRHPPRRPS